MNIPNEHWNTAVMNYVKKVLLTIHFLLYESWSCTLWDLCATQYIWMTSGKINWAHHVVGKYGQQQFQFIRVDVDVGLDCVARPDGPALKHLSTKSLVWDKIKAPKRMWYRTCKRLHFNTFFQLKADAIYGVKTIWWEKNNWSRC